MENILEEQIGSLTVLAYASIFFVAHLLLHGTIGCLGWEISSNPGFAAHQLCFLVCMSFCAIYGCWLWANHAAGIDDKVYGYSSGASFLSAFNCAFQVYDLVISISVQTLRKTDRIVHHVVALILAFWSYHYRLLLYYSIFFFGVSEVSSVFLTFVEFFKEFPPLRNPALNPNLAQFNEISRIVFACLFLSIRVVYWPYLSMQFWGDTLNAIWTGKPHFFELTCVLLANIGLTILQFHWGILILQQIRKKLRAEPSDAIKQEGNHYGAIA
mmetsp:Transcript_15803/g.38954  ORF Transcript_15803/g.38954 Transcript_15803/m.38954 type:complete len:270 (-) Transcript_15803:165-974(-)